MASVQVVVGVWDSAAGVYGRPAFFTSTGVAIRSFSDEVKRKEEGNQMAQHPDDFSLHLLGTFDDVTGVLVADSSRQMLVRGKDVAV